MTSAKVKTVPALPSRSTFQHIILFLICEVFFVPFFFSCGVFIVPCFPIYLSAVLLEFENRCSNLNFYEQALSFAISFSHFIQVGTIAMFLCLIPFVFVCISLWYLDLGRYDNIRYMHCLFPVGQISNLNMCSNFFSIEN